LKNIFSLNKMAGSIVQKIIISLIAAVIFFLVSSPFMYDFTNKIGLKTEKSSGCPSTQGLLIHSAVFFIIVFLIMMIPMGKK